MAGKLTFHLVSPERELYAGEVDEVIIPGTEGEIGVLANHAPLMTSLLPGMLKIREAGKETLIFIKGGFADITPAGLTVLAERAVPAEELTGEKLAAEKAAADAALKDADAPEAVIAAQRAIDMLAAR